MTRQQKRKLQKQTDVTMNKLVSDMIQELFPESIGDRHSEEYALSVLKSIGIDTRIKNGLTELVEEGYIKL